MNTMRKRVDRLEEISAPGGTRGRVVLFGGAQSEDEVKAFLKNNGRDPESEVIFFSTVYLDRDGNVDPNSGPLHLVEAA